MSVEWNNMREICSEGVSTSYAENNNKKFLISDKPLKNYHAII